MHDPEEPEPEVPVPEYEAVPPPVKDGFGFRV